MNFSPLIDFLVQATATLVGAAAAFALESRRQKRREHRDDIGKVKSALFVLISQRTFLRNLAVQHLDPVKDNPHRSFLLLPLTAAPSSLSIKIEDLTFLLDLGDKDLLPIIEIADLRFRTVASLLAERNRLHYEFQLQMERLS
jgi:hypothetical protein